MRVAITGGSGFVGRHLAERFAADETVLISRRTGVAIDDVDALAAAFAGCDVVAHCAGINREIGDQTYERVHIRGTESVIAAAQRAGISKLILMSFLRARPGTKSPYHESKWRAEELVRASGLDYTVLKAGMVFGRGDHMIDHLSHTVQTFPLFGTVGLRERPVAPIAVDDMADVLEAAVRGRLSRQTVAVTGGETLLMSEAVRRVARVLGRRVAVVPLPVWAIYALGQVTEWIMRVPLIATAQVRMLAEGVTEAAPLADALPDDLQPRTPFSEDRIRANLPEPGGFGWRDLRVSRG
jgi:NADH dehydrogenase